MAKRKKPRKAGSSRASGSAAKAAQGQQAEAGAKVASRFASGGVWDPTLAGLWLLLLMPPLIFVPGLTDNFRLPKLLLTELLGLVSLLFLALRLWRTPRIDWRALVRRPAVAAVAPLVAVTSLSWWLGDHLEITRRALPSLWIGAACLVGWSLALGEDERRRLLRLLMWPAALLALLAVLQFHGLFDPFRFQSKVTDRIRLTSLAGGAFDLSGYLVLPILIAQASWQRASARGRVALGAFLLIACWASVASRTVTALVALVVGSLLLWRRRLPRRRLAAALAAGAAVILALAVFGPLKGRAESLTESLRQGEVNRLLTGRLDAWRGAMWMLGEHPILGVGQGAFRAEYGQARVALTEQGVRFFREQRQVFFTNAHSDLLDSAAEWGLSGLLALTWAAGIAARNLRRRWRRPEAEGEGPPEPDPAVDFEIAAIASLGVLCLTYFPLHLGLLAYPWLLFLGGLLSGPAPERPAASEAQAGRRSSRGRPWAVMAALILLLAGASALRFEKARQLIGANRLLAASEATIFQAASRVEGSLPPALLRRNLEWLRQASQLDPAEVGVPLAEGGQYFLMQRYQAAERAYRRALKLEMRGEIYANIARCRLASGDREAALEAIDQAVLLDHTQRRTFKDILTIENQRRRKESAAGM